MEYLPTFLIHDRHLAKWEDDVNNKMIFKWTQRVVSEMPQIRESLRLISWGGELSALGVSPGRWEALVLVWEFTFPSFPK